MPGKSRSRYPVGDAVIEHRLAKRLKTYRTAHKYTQVELGELLGYPTWYSRDGQKSCSSISYIESSRHRVSPYILYRLAKIYQTSIDTFLQDAEPQIDVHKHIDPTLILSKETELNVAIGRRIKYLRILQGHSQNELVHVFGFTTQRTISCIELGKSGIQVASLYRLARYLHVPMSYFFQDLEDAA